MVRFTATVGLLLAFFFALQNNSEFWVINRDFCPITAEPSSPICMAATDIYGAPGATTCGEAESRGCGSQCESLPAEPESEFDCQSQCNSTGSDCREADPPDFCRKIDCIDKCERIPCCLLVHLFWGEVPAKPAINTDQPDHPAPQFAVFDTPFHKSPNLTDNPDPPWSVHPSISTTVLRI